MLDTVSSMKNTAAPPLDDINLRIARRVAGLRAGSGLSLDALALRSGVSRSTISLIERGETSATAVVLERLAAGLGVALAALFEAERAMPGPLMRRAEQPQWRDPASGYLRRNVSAPDHPSPLRIVEVEFPAGQRVVLEGGGHGAVIQQQVWLLEGRMALTHAGQTWRLEAGDCLAMRVDGPVEFRNPTRSSARYAVVIATGISTGIATGTATAKARPARPAATGARR
jgi:transcriptional regulator with XRE-family HTH domain